MCWTCGYRRDVHYRQNPKVWVRRDLWLYIRLFKDSVLWLFFFLLWPSEFDNEIRMHISAYADICQHDVRDVHTGSLQSAGSCLWKLVAGKPDRASDLWPSTQIRITSSSSEAWLLLPNTPLWLLNNPSGKPSQPEPERPPGPGPLSISPFLPLVSNTTKKEPDALKIKTMDKLSSVSGEAEARL